MEAGGAGGAADGLGGRGAAEGSRAAEGKEDLTNSGSDPEHLNGASDNEPPDPDGNDSSGHWIRGVVSWSCSTRRSSFASRCVLALMKFSIWLVPTGRTGPAGPGFWDHRGRPAWTVFCPPEHQVQPSHFDLLSLNEKEKTDPRG